MAIIEAAPDVEVKPVKLTPQVYAVRHIDSGWILKVTTDDKIAAPDGYEKVPVADDFKLETDKGLDADGKVIVVAAEDIVAAKTALDVLSPLEQSLLDAWSALAADPSPANLQALAIVERDRRKPRPRF